MSCIKCEDTNQIETYVRVGNSNVMITGCEEHLKELLRLLRVAHESEGDK